MARPKLPARARRVKINLTLSRDAKKALEKLARAAGLSASQYVEMLVRERESK